MNSYGEHLLAGSTLSSYTKLSLYYTVLILHCPTKLSIYYTVDILHCPYSILSFFYTVLCHTVHTTLSIPHGPLPHYPILHCPIRYLILNVTEKNKFKFLTPLVQYTKHPRHSSCSILYTSVIAPAVYYTPVS